MAEELKPHHYWREDRITGRLVVITPDEYEQWGKDNQPSEAYRPAFARAQLPSQGGEAVEVVAHMYQHDETGVVGFVDQQQVEWGFEKINPRLHLCGELMTVAQHQRILAASAGSADHVGVVFTMEALAPGGGVKSHASLNRDLPAGTKLYTHPADQVADDLTMVKASRELLEQIAVELEHDNDRYFLGRELRALLAAASPQ